jgi:Predicted metal-dependent hydrolase with the TIM-barrel fold
MKLLDGYTMMHEHITIDLSGMKQDADACLNEREPTIAELKELYRYGVRNILDVTAMGMGRDSAYVQKIAEETGIQILQSTGFYKDPFLPEIVATSSVVELAELFVREIEEGIDGGLIKASCIGEIGTSNQEMTANEEKVFVAAVIAAKKTNALISTHTTLGTFAKEQIQFFIKHGIEPDRVVIGHTALANDLALIKDIIRLGFNVAFDTIGKKSYLPEEERVRFLLELEKEAVLDHVVMSMDITRKSHLKKNSGIGYAYLFEVFIPLLKEAGFQEESLNQILIENPKRLLHR